MDKREALTILADYNFWGGYRPTMVTRQDYMSMLDRLLAGREIVVLRGVRRAGKSSLIAEFVRQQTLREPRDGLIINLEDARLPVNLTTEHLEEIFSAYAESIGKYPKYVVLDEVQNVRGWERFARLLAETRGAKTIVTGSSSALMSEEYATVLTGRHLDMEVFPLSFSEFLQFKGLHLKGKLDHLTRKIGILASLHQFLLFGGFPAVVLTDDETRKLELLRAYFTDITVKDVSRRYGIRKQGQLEALARILVSNTSSIQSYRSLASALQLSLDSVERFSRYLETARLFFFVSNFSYSTRGQVRSQKKVYAADTGFYQAEGFKFSDNIGRLMENAVGLELLRRRSLTPGMEIYYYREDCEVDFVVKSGRHVSELIQVAYASSISEVPERETRSLLKASGRLRCGNLKVVTYDCAKEVKLEGKVVTMVPIWEWLLGPVSI